MSNKIFNTAPSAPITNLVLTGTFKKCRNIFVSKRIQSAINKTEQEIIGISVPNNKGHTTKYSAKLIKSDIEKGWLKWKVCPIAGGGEFGE